MKTQSPIRLFFCLVVSLLLQACASKPAPLNYYDFGAVAKPEEKTPICRLPLIQLADITAPTALSSNMMLYRLLYADDQQSHSYANHRWNMTPSQLLTQRIKMQLALRGVSLIDSGIISSNSNLNVLQLRLEVEDFNQYFTDATRSYAQLQIRASLIRDRKLLAQTMLQQQVNTDSADAPSGAKAMRKATDELILNLTHWLCEQVPQ